MVAGSYSPFIFKVSGEAFEPGWLIGYVTNGTVGCGQKNEEVVIKVVKVFLAPQVLY